MPNYRRAKTPGATYFFTVVTYQRRRVLVDPDLCHALRNGIALARRNYPFNIIAWVLLPDHLHCLLEMPAGDSDYSVRWGIIKRHVSRSCGGRLKQAPLRTDSTLRRGESTLWQRRFWEHQIRDEDDLRRHLDYIHWNPVKHGHAQSAAQWPYSTFHRFVERGLYPVDWGGRGLADDGGFGE